MATIADAAPVAETASRSSSSVAVPNTAGKVGYVVKLQRRLKRAVLRLTARIAQPLVETMSEAQIHVLVASYLRERGIDPTSEKRLKDPDFRFTAQPDIRFDHEGITWFLEIKRRTSHGHLQGAYTGLGQALHYLTLSGHNGYDRTRARAALVVEKGVNWPSDAFIDTCECAGVEVWKWDNSELTRWSSRRGSSLSGELGVLHPLAFPLPMAIVPEVRSA